MIRIKRLVALFFCLAFVTCQTRPIKKATPRVPTGEDAGEGGGNGDSADSTAPLGEANSNPDFQQPAEKKPAESFKDAVASIKVAAQKYLDARKEEQQIPENSEPANPEAERLAQITEVLDQAAEEIVQTPDEEMIERISDSEVVAAVTAGAMGEQADNGQVPTFGRNLAIAGGSIFLVSAVAGFVSYQKLKTSVGDLFESDNGKARFREVASYIKTGMERARLYQQLEGAVLGKIQQLGVPEGPEGFPAPEEATRWVRSSNRRTFQYNQVGVLPDSEKIQLASHYRELQKLHNEFARDQRLGDSAFKLPEGFEIEVVQKDAQKLRDLRSQIDEKAIESHSYSRDRFLSPADYQHKLLYGDGEYRSTPVTPEEAAAVEKYRSQLFEMNDILDRAHPDAHLERLIQVPSRQEVFGSFDGVWQELMPEWSYSKSSRGYLSPEGYERQVLSQHELRDVYGEGRNPPTQAEYEKLLKQRQKVLDEAKLPIAELEEFNRQLPDEYKSTVLEERTQAVKAYAQVAREQTLTPEYFKQLREEYHLKYGVPMEGYESQLRRYSSPRSSQFADFQSEMPDRSLWELKNQEATSKLSIIKKMARKVRAFFANERYQAKAKIEQYVYGSKQPSIGKQRLVAIGSIFGMFIGMGVASLGVTQMAGAGLAANTMEKKTNPRAEWADALSWGEGSILYLNFVK